MSAYTPGSTQLSAGLGWVSTRYAWVYVAVTSTVWLPVCPLV